MAWYNESTNENWSDQKEGITNNEAEYLAIYNALSSVKDKDVEVLSDSKVAVNQLSREWHIREASLRQLFDKIQDLINEKGLNVRFVWIPREKNKTGKYLG